MSSPSTPPPARLACRHPHDRLIAAALARAVGRRAGLGPRACAEIALATAELASNAVRHGGGGEIELDVVVDAGRSGVRVVCRDAGPGIADVEAALRDGWSQGRQLGPDDPWREGLGTGLGAVKRACPDLSIESAPGRGTVVIARRFAERARRET